MTPMQFKTAIRDLEREVGSKADVYAHIATKSGPVISGVIYPFGIGSNKGSVRSSADDFETLLANLRASWAEHKEEHAKQTIRKMALEIIRITADFGECRDAGLRTAGFLHEEIARFGSAACVDANDIAGRGPFAILESGAVNAA